MVNAGVYTRISSDRTGFGLGVARQESDCRELATRLGWSVVEVYQDNDLSAYSGKSRPAYEQLLAAVEAGHITGVVSWDPDRLHRSPKELERFIDLAERAGLQVQTVKAGPIDLSSPSGRAVARTLGAWARYESEHKSDRIRRKLRENALLGIDHGTGGKRCYGFEPDNKTARPSEVAVIREAYSRLLAGESVRSVFRDLNTRGLFNAGGTVWTHTTFRGMVLRARNAAVRTYLGEEVARGKWAELIEPSQWRALVRLLNDPARVMTPGRAGKLHMLSGLARCGQCGGPMRVCGTPYGAAYRCQHRSCVVRPQARVDALVSAAVVTRLSMPDAVDLLLPPDDAPARAAASERAERLRERLDEAAALFAGGELTGRQLATITSELRPQLAEVEAACAPARDRLRLFGGVIGVDDVAETWLTLPVDRQRAVIDSLVSVRVLRTSKGPRFIPEHVEITWKS